jgi:hypothetical protein
MLLPNRGLPRRSRLRRRPTNLPFRVDHDVRGIARARQALRATDWNG